MLGSEPILSTLLRLHPGRAGRRAEVTDLDRLFVDSTALRAGSTAARTDLAERLRSLGPDIVGYARVRALWLALTVVQAGEGGWTRLGDACDDAGPRVEQLVRDALARLEDTNRARSATDALTVSLGTWCYSACVSPRRARSRPRAHELAAGGRAAARLRGARRPRSPLRGGRRRRLRPARARAGDRGRGQRSGLADRRLRAPRRGGRRRARAPLRPHPRDASGATRLGDGLGREPHELAGAAVDPARLQRPQPARLRATGVVHDVASRALLARRSGGRRHRGPGSARHERARSADGRRRRDRPDRRSDHRRERRRA